MNGRSSWGAQFFDFDNDGDRDIIAANGTAEELILQYPLLLENDGKGHFKNSGQLYGDYFSTLRSGRGLATVDIDNDGDLDVIVSHLDKKATPVLLKNDGGSNNHWLGITLKGKKGPASALGAKVTITSGGKKQVLFNQPATTYLSNNDPRIHAGLGIFIKADLIEVRWADGTTDILKNVPADHYYVITQGEGREK